MFDPSFNITPQMLKDIAKVEAAKAIIENSPLLPLYERQFKTEATVRKVHFSTAIEGNYLDLDEVRKLVGDPNLSSKRTSDSVSTFINNSGEEVIARKRDIHEVVNYRDVVRYIERLVKKLKMEDEDRAESVEGSLAIDLPRFYITEDMIKDVHEILMKNIEDKNAGKYRQARAVTVNYMTGEKHAPYEAYGNIYLKMRDLVDWYNGPSAKEIHPIFKAGILHLEIVRIHPFEEANGRLARALATLSLSIDGYDVGHFFCLDEYYDSNAQDYYKYLAEGFANLTAWLEYFVLGMAVEFNRVKERVVKISKDAKVKEKTGQVFITERQEKIIEWLNNYGSFKNADFDELFSSISDDTVLRELKGLLDAGIIVKRGKTKSARYELG